MDRIRPYLPQLFFAGVAVIVLWSLLAPGYILTVDMMFTPRISVPAYASSSLPFWELLHILSSFVPSWILEKLLLFAILFLSGWGMYRWVETLQPKALQNDWRIGSLFAGTLYVFNPFTYSRFMAGQFSVLLGYMLVPFFAYSLWVFCQKPSIKQALRLAGWVTLIAILSLYSLGPAFILGALIAFRFALFNLHNRGWRIAVLKGLACTLLAALTVNSYWFISLLTGHGQTNQIINHFSAADAAAFATVPGAFGLIGNVFTLQGFWADGRNLYLLPSDVFSWWWIPLILLVGLVLSGLIWAWQHQRANAAIFVTTCAVGGVLAIGTAGTIFASFNMFLERHVPLFAGYREPEKFSALIVFGYSYFAAVGLNVFLRALYRKRLSNDIRQILVISVFCIPLFCVPLMPFGFHGQLHSVQYPSDWYSMQRYLQSQGSLKTVFLPWHLYMPYNFTKRVIASPAQSFFNIPIVSSNDPEFKGASAYSQTQDQKDVGALLASSSTRLQLGAELRSTTDIKFVLLAKDYDYANYAYLDHDLNLQLVKETTNLKLYKVREN